MQPFPQRSAAAEAPLPRHLRAIVEALLVTVLWSSSWVLIKAGLADIPPLTFAGLRYALAALILLPLALRLVGPATLRALTGRQWVLLAGFGLLQYSLTQGAQFLSLAVLPATTLSLLLAFSPALVALLGAGLLGERIERVQWLGIAAFGAGALIYFGPAGLPRGQGWGLVLGLVCLLANASQAILGRHINRSGLFAPLLVTAVSMSLGAAVLLGTGLAVQGLPPLSAANWLTIGWLAVVNTAFAFWLWNRTQRTLSAVESSLINNTMLIQIVLLAWVFIGERPTPLQLAGIALAFCGVLVVQVRGALRAHAATR